MTEPSPPSPRYTHLMYVVVPHNDAFLLYVAAIGLGFYLLLDGLLGLDVRALRSAFAATPQRLIGWFLVTTGGLFAIMWLSMIVPTIPGGLPDGLFVYDVPEHRARARPGLHPAPAHRHRLSWPRCT